MQRVHNASVDSKIALAKPAALRCARVRSPTMVVHVVLSLPLSALALSVGGNGTRLICRAPRHHVPPGVSPDQPLQLEFDELWRCSAAKGQVETACTAARAEQHRALVAMLGQAAPAPTAGDKVIERR